MHIEVKLNIFVYILISMNYKSYGSEHKNWVIMEDIADIR